MKQLLQNYLLSVFSICSRVMTYRYLTKKVLNEAKEYFQLDVEAYLREEFLKQSVGN